MASLRQSYEDWIMNDPSDKRSDIDDENPTDEMMERFEREEQEHKDQVSQVLCLSCVERPICASFLLCITICSSTPNLTIRFDE